MNNQSKQLYEKLLDKLRKRYGARYNDIAFQLDKNQGLEFVENIQQRSDFLMQINMPQVYQTENRKLYGATEKAPTGRKQAGRNRATLTHDQHGYKLVETDSGVIVPWELFDTFALYPNLFEQIYEGYVRDQIALDMLQIGWHGQSIAPDTEKADLSDVNKGWLKLLSEQRPANFLTDGDKKSGQIKIFGDDADYADLDALALDLKQGLDARHRNRNDLVFMVGSELLTKEKKLIIENVQDKPRERTALAAHSLLVNFGGMTSLTPPNFPAKGAAVTTLNNLSIYSQLQSWRYSLTDDEEIKAVVNSCYRYEGYVVEDLGLMTAIDHSKVVLG